MSESGDVRTPTQAELDAMSRDEIVTAGLAQDHVDVVYRRERWPVPGTRAEKRAERIIALWFLVAAACGLGAAVAFIAWPWQYKGRTDSGNLMYSLYTPVLGVLVGVGVLAVGIAVVKIRKTIIPHELSIQERYDGAGSGSPEFEKRALVSQLADALETSTLPRRKMITRTAGLGMGALGLGAGVVFVGGLVKNPWAKGDKAPLWVTGWTPDYPGQTVYLRRDTGRPEDISLVRPEDLDAGGLETVFPHKAEHKGNEEELLHELRGVRNGVMLIRFRPEDGARALKRKGQESFNYGDYWAYSKICTHLGCPTSLYEQQDQHILCPCHQSQFNALHWGKPIFGPAARALPQLPITVNSEGYLVANGDFAEPLGPAFWERKS
ncbi:MAG: ubiquinol-cytochrome c reductase iron-sulfur subunit [Mycobacteriaceae bacterium]|nr:ubiquinol-cytochrome c reductase iron-sulfur subunit [Mycobacteriaceae bacterium]